MRVGKRTGSKADNKHTSAKCQRPNWNGCFRSREFTGVPNMEDNGERTDSIGDIISAMGEGGNASGEDLKEGVEMLSVVGVLPRAGVDFSNTASILVTPLSLQRMHVDVGTVSENLHDEGEDTVASDDPKVFRKDPGSFNRVSFDFFSKVAGLSRNRSWDLLDIGRLLLFVALLGVTVFG